MHNRILITGGIGDVVCLQSYQDRTFRENLGEIVWATRRADLLIPLWQTLPDYPNCHKHTIIPTDWEKQWCYHSLSQLNASIPEPVVNCQDWSISQKFREINEGLYTFTGSSFLAHRLAALDSFALPLRYYVIQPYTALNKINHARERAFRPADWDATVRLLQERDCFGVVLNVGCDPIPASELLVDLSDLTTLAESVEILKCAEGYIGIDSWLSVLAAQLFDGEHLRIKVINTHPMAFKHIYYAPHSTFAFMVPSI